MSQRGRIIIGIVALVVLLAGVLGVEALRRSAASLPGAAAAGVTAAPGTIPIYLDGKLVAAFGPADLEKVAKASFVDAEEGKTQDGWLLADALRLYLDPDQLQPETVIVVSSSSRNKAAEIAWREVQDPANHVMFDLASRGTMKLVSTLERLDTRDEWVQDVDRIEVTGP